MLTVRNRKRQCWSAGGRGRPIFTNRFFINLKTRNMPVLTTLEAGRTVFSSPSKAEVYFFNMRPFHRSEMGNQNPIMLRRQKEIRSASDSRAFGTLFDFALRNRFTFYQGNLSVTMVNFQTGLKFSDQAFRNLICGHALRYYR